MFRNNPLEEIQRENAEYYRRYGNMEKVREVGRRLAETFPGLPWKAPETSEDATRITLEGIEHIDFKGKLNALQEAFENAFRMQLGYSNFLFSTVHEKGDLQSKHHTAGTPEGDNRRWGKNYISISTQPFIDCFVSGPEGSDDNMAMLAMDKNLQTAVKDVRDAIVLARAGVTPKTEGRGC